MTFEVVFSHQAAEDLERLYNFALERELRSDTADFSIPERALQAIKDGVNTLSRTPFTCRKVGQSPFLRELVIPFGRSGYIALFEIASKDTVIVGAIRHQSEDDYFD